MYDTREDPGKGSLVKIRDHVDAIPQPTVVRLDDLQARDSAWISDSYYITAETERHLKALQVLLSRENGCGVFLIGHYGSGKSHFLAYLAQQIRTGSFAPRSPFIQPLSLLNYKAAQPLEDIVDEALAITHTGIDRREAWRQIEERYPGGLFVMIDELSEFLRSKPSTKSYNEDLRFLQFLGEWAQEHPLWILAALQEQIEHTGDIEYDLYRKIKDRYPIRFLLTPTHVKDLIAGRILRKKASYAAAVEKLAQELMAVYPAGFLDYGEFCEVYPLHPVTLELLEEVRDRFSQARGIVDFTLTQLLGNEARAAKPILDQPWGHLITPDIIVDHFADLFEVQPEFLSIAQKVLPYFRRYVADFFPKEAQQELAWRLIKLLILVHLSPRRKSLDVEEAALWLLLKVSSIDPAKNRDVIRHTLDVLFEKGQFLKRQGTRYRLDLEDESRESMDLLLSREVEELKDRGEAIFEELLPLLRQAEFNPFALPRDRWHTRKVRWHFHDRDIQIFLGGGLPPEQKGLALQIGLPWGPPPQGRHCFKIVPAPMEPTPDILELAALLQLQERPLPPEVLRRIQARLAGRTGWFCSLVRAAYREAQVIDPAEGNAAPPLHSMQGGHAEWLNACGEWMLKRTYPLFERYAPVHGPLHREAYRQFMKFASEHDLCAEDAPESVKLIREAYLVPLGLMQRRGAEYFMNFKLDSHDLVRLVAPLVEHHPAPARIYEHLSAPVYGLVTDQIHLLLLILLIQGEIDIVKGRRSYRETYQTLPNPQQYDKILPGYALSLIQLRGLQTLCEGLHIPTPRQWSVLSQKRVIDQIRKYGSRRRDLLSPFVRALQEQGEAVGLASEVEKHITKWLALEKGEHELQGFQHFLFEIGSPERFLAEAAELASLPGRFEKLLSESRRFRHLLSYPCLSQCSNPDIASAVEALSQPPSLAEPEALQSWLNHAQSLYHNYQDWYRREHVKWQTAADRHAIWSYRIPKVSRSKHVALASLIQSIEALQEKARAARCSGSGILDFQPFCRCGFDGAASPLAELLLRFEESVRRLEAETTLFFQQDKVKAKVREWVDQKLEINNLALSYLEGKAGYPDVENLPLFDQHLSGLELAQPLKADSLIDLLEERVWEKSALMKALDQFLGRFGPRIVFRRDAPAPRRDLLAWCCELALKQGAPLPAVFTPAEQSLMAGLILPEWIHEESLQKLEQMGMGEEALLRVLDLFLDGLVRMPRKPPAAGAVAAAVELINPQQPASAESLAQKIELLYNQNERFLKLRPRLWLSRLNALAETELDAAEALDGLLQRHLDAQWLVIDCLGLPLLSALQELLGDCLPHWGLESVEFGMVSGKSSTDAFYLGLLEGEVKKSFEKINCIDALIHTRKAAYSSLVRLARAELEIAFRKTGPKLDPSLPLCIFGDHGFRMNADGAGFGHGGPSTLERLTPLLSLVPFRGSL